MRYIAHMSQSITFFKYHGAGNDFIIIDYEQNPIELTQAQIASLCKRRYGVGADGLMYYRSSKTHDFEMVYFNSDGSESSFCGNGARCIVRFALKHKGLNSKITFSFKGDSYQAEAQGDEIKLRMNPVSLIDELPSGNLFLDTGSPHQIIWVNNLAELDVDTKGRSIRNAFSEAGCNVNFVEKLEDNQFAIRTYERGVEAETHACGTGITAAAIAAHFQGKSNSNEIKLKAVGGSLIVSFEPNHTGYQNIYLQGPAVEVYTGSLSLI